MEDWMPAKRRIGRKINIGTLMLEGSFGVFLAVVIFIIFISIFSDKFFTATNFFATSRTFSLWIVVGFAQNQPPREHLIGPYLHGIAGFFP